ncbi:myosin-6-like, partial [Trifolium medium]|nr:myosin-6-like [Trifolium medium]
LEEKFTDVEFANQLLQKQSLLNTSVKTTTEHLSSPVSKKLENGYHVAEEQNDVDIYVTPVKQYVTESDSKLKRSCSERHY